MCTPEWDSRTPGHSGEIHYPAGGSTGTGRCVPGCATAWFGLAQVRESEPVAPRNLVRGAAWQRGRDRGLGTTSVVAGGVIVLSQPSC